MGGKKEKFLYFKVLTKFYNYIQMPVSAAS